MMSRSLVMAAAAALVAGCAAQDATPEGVAAAGGGADRDCFYLSQVNGFSPAGKDKIHVNVGPGRDYEFRTFGSCPEIDYSEMIAFDKKGPGTICRGMDVDLIVPTSIGPQRCPVSMIRRLPPKQNKP